MPRAAVKAGLPGLGQDIFPESARELGRVLGFYPEQVVVLRHTGTDSAGAVKDTYSPESAIRGRIDAGGRMGRAEVRAAIVSESATHLVSMDAVVELSVRDRLQVQGLVWLITAVHVVTDKLITRVEVKPA